MYATPSALFAHTALPSMLADAATPALLALTALPPVLACFLAGSSWLDIVSLSQTVTLCLCVCLIAFCSSLRYTVLSLQAVYVT